MSPSAPYTICSASDRLPRCSTLFTTCVTTTDRYTGSGMRSRRDAGPLRGTSALPLRAVAAPRLSASVHAAGIERAAHDLVADTRQIGDAAPTYQDDRVL